MTRRGILKTDGDKVTPEERLGVLGKLEGITALLHEVRQLNDKMQGQFASGSATWHTCESIDDKLHEIAVLLGE